MNLIRLASLALVIVSTAGCAGLRLEKEDGAGKKVGKVAVRTLLGVATLGLSEIEIDSQGTKKDWERACTQVHHIEIISDPPGARIEVNNEFLGETPIAAKVSRGCSSYSLNNITIRASPVQPGHCSQGKFIGGSDAVPAKVFFDTRLCPIRTAVDVNLNQ